MVEALGMAVNSRADTEFSILDHGSWVLQSPRKSILISSGAALSRRGRPHAESTLVKAIPGFPSFFRAPDFEAVPHLDEAESICSQTRQRQGDGFSEWTAHIYETLGETVATTRFSAFILTRLIAG